MSRIRIEDVYGLAKTLNKRIKTMDYEKAVRTYLDDGVEKYSLDHVGVWCPGNGEASTYDAIALTLLTAPKKLTVFVSENADYYSLEEIFQSSLSESNIETRLNLVTGDRQTRIGRLKELSFDFMIVYGSDSTCRRVLSEIDVLTPRMVYGSKTSISIHNTDESIEGYIEDFFKDATDGGGVGCLNTSILYVNRDSYEREAFFEKYEELLEVKEPSTTFLAHAYKEGADVLSVSRGGFVVEREEQEVVQGDFPSAGVGRGTLMVVPTSDPVEAFISEWTGYEKYLSSCTMTEVDKRVYDLGVSRITDPSKAQHPTHNWKHDGMNPVPNTYRVVGVDK